MSAHRQSRVDRLRDGQLAVIDALYATVTDPERWAEVVRAATNLVGAGVSSVLYRSGPHVLNQRLLATDLDPSAARSYEAYYGAINPWIVYQRNDRPLLETRESMLRSPEQIEHSEFYADWLSPLDLRYSYRPPWNTGPLALDPVSAPRQTKRPDEARLRSLFDLTPAEARLVAALYDGRTLASHADSTGTSLNTVKTHLKHVFDKTGETRQVDLVRRVATGLALRFEAGAFK